MPSAITPAAHGICPAEMVLVSGDYCTQVEHTCKRWLDDDLLPYARCAEYEPPARCVGKRQSFKFCIDQREYTAPGETLPKNYASFIESSKVCESLGKRVCTESEWNFACEGPEMLPYPYGWIRRDVCNQDRTDLFEPNPKMQMLRDHRKTSGELASCKSPFGVFDMVGNMDEPVLREAQRYAYPFRNGLKGGWWMAGRNRCRPATTAHDDHYRDIQIGIRCCRDAN
ncbi:MAG: formylglycine-generating enzyme family protein [Myxococcota bacterium]